MNWNSAPSIRVKNVSGSEIPARSFVKLNGNSGGTHFEHYVEVDQPDGTEGDYYLVTGPHAIADTKIGIAYFPFAPVKVKHSSVPSYVEEVGPASGSWQADPDGTGFVALKQDGDCSFIVNLNSGGSSSGDFAIVTPTGEVCDGIGFTCDCAIASVVTASCGSGVAPGDLINVWDLCRLWFNMPNELLTQTNFYCQYVKVHESDYNRPPGLTGDCRWVVTGMCCREVEYYGY